MNVKVVSNEKIVKSIRPFVNLNPSELRDTLFAVSLDVKLFHSTPIEKTLPVLNALIEELAKRN